MTTEILAPTSINILKCAAQIKKGGLVAFPTETVYALGADATDARAVKKVYDAKGRPTDKPFIVAVARKSDITKVAKRLPEKARRLADRFMPGALTLLLDKADGIPDIVTAGTKTVAVRIPDNATALKLIEFVGRPVVVPSANTSDKPSPTLAAHVKDDLDGKIDLILDGGESKIGVESTIIDTRVEPPVIVRVGGVSVEAIERVIGKVTVKSQANKPSNYKPSAEIMFSAYYTGMARYIAERYDELDADGRKPVIICLEGNIGEYGDRNVYSAGADYESFAHGLFALLRRADAEHCGAVIVEGVKPEGIGITLINRLIRVSGGNII